MKLIVTVRTRNERDNIAKFCSSYYFADKILVADGGSTDNTVSIAQTFDNVVVRKFDERVELENGYWKNHAGKHCNFLLNWAKEEGADWTIFDDCDCIPNFVLRRNLLSVLLKADSENKNMLYATRLYLYGGYQYFPSLSQNKLGVWTPGLYGWSKESGLVFDEENAITQSWQSDLAQDIHTVYPPMVLLHCAWPDEEVVNKKLDFYRNSGQSPDMLHPTEFGGTLEKLPKWVRE